MISDSYSPRSWRSHPLHIVPIDEPDQPPPPFEGSDDSESDHQESETQSRERWNKGMLDWIFLISSLNFSFWSELDGTEERFGVEWRESWASEKRVTFTGYWSLVAALNRGRFRRRRRDKVLRAQ